MKRYYMSLIDTIMSRRSNRSLRPDPVPQEVVKKILECANAAPNPHNSRPWHFILIDDQRVKGKLSEAMVNSYRMSGQKDESILDSARIKTTKPALSIIGCIDKLKLKANTELEYFMATQGLAAAAENILLAAAALGLGAYWRAAPLTCMQAVRDVLGMPTHVDPQWMIHIGFIERPAKGIQRTAEGVNHYNGW